MKYIQHAHKCKHDGFMYMRDAMELITLPRPGGDHDCLIQIPLGQSLYDMRVQLQKRMVTVNDIKSMLQQLLWALEYLHTFCRLVHTGTTP